MSIIDKMDEVIDTYNFEIGKEPVYIYMSRKNRREYIDILHNFHKENYERVGPMSTVKDSRGIPSFVYREVFVCCHPTVVGDQMIGTEEALKTVEWKFYR